MGVLVFTAIYLGHPQPQHQLEVQRDLVRAAVEWASKVPVHCLLNSHREHKVWAKCTTEGNDIWSLAQRQTLLHNGSLVANTFPGTI
jgi:hypothetical protein